MDKKSQIIDREPQTIEEEREKWCEHIPKIYQETYRRAMAGKSKAAGIKAKCQDCCCWQRTEIENCAVPTCPLYPYRPYQHHDQKRLRHPTESNLTQKEAHHGAV